MTKTAVIEFVNALKFKISIPDSNFLLLANLVLQVSETYHFKTNQAFYLIIKIRKRFEICLDAYHEEFFFRIQEEQW